jgi:hypothetical protein
MDQYKYLNKTNKVKDSSKGQKIAAALYLVTNHLSDTDPLKLALRTHAVAIGTVTHEDTILTTASAINGLLQVATIAHLISEKNSSIITLELRHYTATMAGESDTLSNLFAPVLDGPTSLSYSTPRTLSQASNTNPRSMSNTSSQNFAKSTIPNESKSKRQDAILSFIDERKSAAIKDIAALFSDTSEKTIQRELSALVSEGKITKRGEKRWSIYLSSR